MKIDENFFGRIELVVLRTALVIMLLLTLIRILLPEVLALKQMVSGE